MVILQIEESLMKELIQFAQESMLTPKNLGVFKKEAHSNVAEVLNAVTLDQFINFESRNVFDDWFDEQIAEFHTSLIPYYKDDLKIQEQHPYTHSARLFTEFLKSFCFRTYLFEHDRENYMYIIHPIISTSFINVFPNLEIKRVKDIRDREHYYSIVNHYRYLIDLDLCPENEFLLKLKVGVDF